MNKFDFSAKSKLDSNILSVEVLKSSDENYQYAYYLMKDNSKAEVIWYTNKNTAQFQLNDSGNYRIICFIQLLGEKVILETCQYSFQLDNQSFFREETASSYKYHISIYGSCVTRDLFELKENTFMQLKSYIARQSILSAVSPPIPCEKDDFKLDSNFKKNAVYNDFVKNSFTLLKNDQSDYIIIDLIDERFSLMSYKNSILTVSSYLIESGYFTDINAVPMVKHYGNQYYYLNTNIKKFLKIFCKRIGEIYEPENIILHKAFMLNKYIDKQMTMHNFDKNHLANNRKINERLSYIYDFLEKKMHCGLVIDICQDFHASENHKWGLAPMHYCEEYYREVLRILEEYLTNKI